VVLVLPEDREKTLDGLSVADQHYPAILGELYIGGVEVPLLRGQPDLVHTSSCTATLSRCLGCSTVCSIRERRRAAAARLRNAPASEVWTG
jgi:hypothetical protein